MHVARGKHLTVVQDRYKGVLTAAREFNWLTTVKRNGMEAVKQLPFGSLAIWCPACPQPGINLDPDWTKREKSLRYVDIWQRLLQLSSYILLQLSRRTVFRLGWQLQGEPEDETE